MNDLKRSWAEIDLDAIAHNYMLLKKRVGQNTMIMSVTKADAYGHGAAYVSRILQECGSDWFAVSNLIEAVELRKAGIRKPILIFGGSYPEHVSYLNEYNLTSTVSSCEEAHALSEAASALNARLPVHIKLDTGMSRMGFGLHQEDTAVKEIATAAALPGIFAQGIYTHFAAADYDGDSDGNFTKLQYQRFMHIIEKLRHHSVDFPIRHCCNSAGTIAHPDMHLDMVRTGIALYGLSPSRELRGLIDLQPAMSLKSTIALLKQLRPGDTVSYGRRFTAEQAVDAAVVPIGYADGYVRAFGGRAHMLVNGRRVPVLGRVCMDQCVVDVTGIHNLHTGDVVTVAGSEDGQTVSIDELSDIAGTINYQTVCLITKRMPRIYLQKGRKVGMEGPSL